MRPAALVLLIAVLDARAMVLHAREVSAAPAEVVIVEESAPRRPGLLRRILGKRYAMPRAAKAFVHDDVRYEPRIRDIRLVPETRNLPGNDAGIPETVPSLPYHRNGYFQIPLR